MTETKKKNKEKYFLFRGMALVNKDTTSVYKMSPRGKNGVETVLLGTKDSSTNGKFMIKKRPSKYNAWPSESIFKTIHYGWLIDEITKEEAFELIL